MSELHTVWEPEQTPEATGSPGVRHTMTQGVKAWGPFRDGRFLVNVGHAEYTPNQALVLAATIARAALEAGAAQAKYDAEHPARPGPEHTHHGGLHEDWMGHDGLPVHKHVGPFGQPKWAPPTLHGQEGADIFLAQMKAADEGSEPDAG